MEKNQHKRMLRKRRKYRIRAKIQGTGVRPRFAIYRSNTSLSAQIIDDTKGATLVSSVIKGNNKEKAGSLGKEIAQKAIAKGIKSVVFDRGGYRYHGTIAQLADAARKEGLAF